MAGASLSASTLLATFATSGFSTVAYNDFTSVAAFLPAINRTGQTLIMVSSSRHENADVPTGNEWITCHEAETSGTSQDPKLVVVASSSSIIFRRRLEGS